MPVTIEYVVEREGVEKATFATKAEADAYDKLLDTADNLTALLEKSALLEDKYVKKLALYLANNRDPLINALAYKRKTTSNKPTTPNTAKKKTNNTPPQSLLDIVIEPDEEVAIQSAVEAVDKSSEAAA